jgi:hypothetical protein
VSPGAEQRPGQPDHITGPRGIQGGALLAEHRLRVFGDERLAGGGVGEDSPRSNVPEYTRA